MAKARKRDVGIELNEIEDETECDLSKKNHYCITVEFFSLSTSENHK